MGDEITVETELRANHMGPCEPLGSLWTLIYI